MKLEKELLAKTKNLPNNLYLSEKVKERRKSLNITQEEIAEAIGVDVKTYRHWENGKTMPENIASLYKLCACLDCEIDFLFGKISLPHKADTDIVDYTGLSVEAVNYLKHLSQNEMYFLSNLLTVNYGKNFRILSENYYHIQNDIKLIKAIEKGLIKDTFEDNYTEAVSDKKFRKFWLTDEISMFSENEALKDIIYFADKE